MTFVGSCKGHSRLLEPEPKRHLAIARAKFAITRMVQFAQFDRDSKSKFKMT